MVVCVPRRGPLHPAFAELTPEQRQAMVAPAVAGRKQAALARAARNPEVRGRALDVVRSAIEQGILTPADVIGGGQA